MRTITQALQIGAGPIIISNPFDEAKHDESKDTKKSTPDTSDRVSAEELELTYLTNPSVFNGVNKIVQLAMSANMELRVKSSRVKKHFNEMLTNLGYSENGSDLTWDELLENIFRHSCIYGKSYVENIPNDRGNRIVDWDTVDPKKMDYAMNTMKKIEFNEYGRVVGYVETLPYEQTVGEQKYEVPDTISLPNNAIYLPRENIAQIKMFKVGDGLYPIGLIEPLYKQSLWKLNIEKAMANSIWRIGFPTTVAKIGDQNHEPTPQQIVNILQKIKDNKFNTEMAVPYYYDLSFLESKTDMDKIVSNLKYFNGEEVAGMGVPKTIVTGEGQTAKSTLGTQSSLLNLTMKDIMDNVVTQIRKYMFAPVCRMEGFKEIPSLTYEIVSTDELNAKARRILQYYKAGMFKDKINLIESKIAEIEGFE